MKSILISIKPKWCALEMNGIKKIEVRKGTALYKATKKLIDEYGYAEFYVYCTKDKEKLYGFELDDVDGEGGNIYFADKKEDLMEINETGFLNGKVIFKFRCYKVEEIKTCERHNPELLHRSCLNANEFYDYLMKGKNFLGRVLGCAIHISDLEIFDRPRELSEFGKREKIIECYNAETNYHIVKYRKCKLTKAPQSWCYVEVWNYE